MQNLQTDGDRMRWMKMNEDTGKWEVVENPTDTAPITQNLMVLLQEIIEKPSRWCKAKLPQGYCHKRPMAASLLCLLLCRTSVAFSSFQPPLCPCLQELKCPNITQQKSWRCYPWSFVSYWVTTITQHIHRLTFSTTDSGPKE
jgi:hypothetical protein